MPNPKPRNRPPFTHDPIWIASGNGGAPRSPAIERLSWGYHPGHGSGISLGVFISRDTPRPRLDKAIGQILTWVLFVSGAQGRGGLAHRDRIERHAVVCAYNADSARKRKRTQTRGYISDKTGVPEHRVKTILRDWRAFLRVWESAAGVKARRRMKREVRKGKHIDSRFFNAAERFIILGRNAANLS